MSTRPSPGSPLDLGRSPDLSVAASHREQDLLDENARLRRICAALIDRVEAGGGAGSAPYGAFEHSVLLAEQVRKRTETLQHTLGELDRAKAAAETANLSKTRFLAAVSHDLLQPLTAARLFASALEEHPLPESAQPLVGHIGRSLKDVESLLGMLVDISRLDAGVLTPDIAPFRVAELLDVLAAEHRQLAATQGLQFEYVPSGAVVVSDLILLARVVRNFLSNALRYTRHGRVLLGCRRRHDGLEIMVGDTGPGIPENQREVIFQEFRRGDSGPRDHDNRGLGLGLAIVDRICSMLDHPLSLHTQPGQGALFSVRVPYAQFSASDGHRRTSLASGEGQQFVGVSVWVIDNDAPIREGMRALLGGWGCRVLAAASLSELESMIGDQHPDVLLVDYHLDDDGPDGLEAAARLRCYYPGLPVVMITANHDAALKTRARREGHDCLLKPLKPLRLRMLLATLLRDAN